MGKFDRRWKEGGCAEGEVEGWRKRYQRNWGRSWRHILHWPREPHAEIDWGSGQQVHGREQLVQTPETPYCLDFGLENLEYQPSLGFSVRVKSLLNYQMACERDVFLPHFLQKGKDLMKNIQWTNSKTEPPCLLAILSWVSLAAHLPPAVKPTETELSLMVIQGWKPAWNFSFLSKKIQIFFTPL